MSEVDKAKEAVDGAKEVVASSGDVVDKVFGHVDSYFKTVAEVLQSDAAKELGQKVVDTGLTVVQVDAILYTVGWVASFLVFSGILYFFLKILIDRFKEIPEEVKKELKAREAVLEGKDYYNRSNSEDRELVSIKEVIRGYKITSSEVRQVIGGFGAALSAAGLLITIFGAFDAWKMVATIYPDLYLVHLAIEKIL